MRLYWARIHRDPIMRRRTFTKHIMVRLSEGDYAAVVRHAEESGVQPAVLGRDLIVHAVRGGDRNIINQADLRGLLTEVGRQGNNINQIAYRLNSGKTDGVSSEQFEALLVTHRQLIAAVVSLSRKSK